jgi:hypothetical protein
MNVFKVDAKRMVDFCDSMSLSFIISINWTPFVETFFKWTNDLQCFNFTVGY